MPGNAHESYGIGRINALGSCFGRDHFLVRFVRGSGNDVRFRDDVDPIQSRQWAHGTSPACGAFGRLESYRWSAGRRRDRAANIIVVKMSHDVLPDSRRSRVRHCRDFHVGGGDHSNSINDESFNPVDDASVRLINRWKQGDETAAGEIFDRYVSRLIALAASRISPGLARRVEAEDVVQSVYRSFFARLGDERLTVEASGQLWGLLAAITINKVRAKARFHAADKRDVQAESSVSASGRCHGLSPMDMAHEPTSDEIAELSEQYQSALNGLSPIGRQVFELFLQNESVDSIAKTIRRSTRTVRRELEQIRTALLDALQASQQEER